MESDGTFTAFGRRGRAGAFPIAHRYGGIRRAAEHAASAPDMKRMSEAWSAAPSSSASTARLQQGLPHRFEAFDQLMERCASIVARHAHAGGAADARTGGAVPGHFGANSKASPVT